MLLALVLTLAADDAVVLLPREVRLHGPAARQTLVLERMKADLALGPAEGAVYESSDPAVVRVEGSTAVPVGDGKATITARAGGRSSTSTVAVVDFSRPFARSFRNHAQPVLARFGCSSGACHGAAAGKNGFRLSLRGYDDEGDFRALTRHALGRRIDPADPGRSLLLLKATGAVEHKGGVRFEPSSREYSVLAEWIAAGSPGPSPDDPRIDRLSVLPTAVRLAPGTEQPLIVLAHFSDGSVFDATPWAKFTGSDSSVAVPDDHGRVKVTGRGEGAVTAWYLQKIAVATVTVPYENRTPGDVFAEAPRANFIDELVLAKLKELDLPPSPPASDAEFLRRAHLDTIGVLPTPDEVRAFLADSAPDRRARLVDRLLARPEFTDYWAYKWSDLLLVSSRGLPRPTMWAYYQWVRNRVAANAPWDSMVRELVTATGGTIENGSASFFLLHDDPTEMAETVSQAFLGMSIQCAKCHNHPMEKWTNDQYYAFANLFSRVRAKSSPRAGNSVVFSAPEGELIQPVTGKPRQPAPLDGEPIAFDAVGDRRLRLADWLVAPENPYFSRSIANRVWANFFGSGLVEAVDDMRKTNPPSNPALLDGLSGHLAKHRFDLKQLMRAILNSETYRRSSEPLPGNAADRRFYSRYTPRRLMAEVALDAMSQVSGAPTRFVEESRNENRKNGAEFPLGLRALQLPDSKTDSVFLKAFGRAERLLTCECERTSAPSMSQALHLSNGDTLNDKLKAKDGRISRLLAENAAPEKIVEEAYLAALSRFPTDVERSRLLAVLAAVPEKERREAVEDLFWGLLSSKEFLFNH